MLELRAAGESAPTIGRLLNVPESTVRNWWAGDQCCECGAYVDRSNGQTHERRCADCQVAFVHATKVWTREAIIARFQEFARVHGRSPSAVDVLCLTPSKRGAYSPRRVAAAVEAKKTTPLPMPRLVAAAFGSWVDAVIAAGLQPGRPGRRPFAESRARAPEAVPSTRETGR